MKKYLLTLFIVYCALFIVPSVHAAYEIEDFSSNIEILQNTRISVAETIQTDFLTPMHGIYRNIPVVYSSGLTRINGKINVISVTDENDLPYKYVTSRQGSNLQIKIGDADNTITGPHTYKITYQAKNIVRHFDDHDELYWNVTGSEWDELIPKSQATVKSDFATINRTDCFTGAVGTTSQKCLIQGSTFVNPNSSGVGEDFTIVVGLAQPNQLRFPGMVEQLVDAGLIWFVLAALPGLFMGYMWLTRGRDMKFVGDNVYFPPASGQTEVAPFGREHLPSVYSPINGLTPSEAGTIIDQKVDLADVVAEIMELARLGYIKIKRIERKKLLVLNDEDYQFTRTSKTAEILKPHQQKLLSALTKDSYMNSDNTYLLSKMKNKFYADLETFKNDLYKTLVDEGIFFGRPDHVKSGWIVGSLVVQYILVQILAPINPLIIPVGIVSGLAAAVFGYFMPRRTAKGHALYRQLVGLQYYVGKGKWRYDIAEKHLFLEEILPLAISLGVISQLTHDMQALALKPPQYMGNIAPGHFGSFQNNLGTSMSSRPSGSRSGWSGGSGFGGGGSSGGGGGGGGGGGW